MIKNWLLAARPKTLSAAVVPVMLGLALPPRPIHVGLAARTLFGALFIQIVANFITHALAFKKGGDTTERLGPVRVTQAGLISAEAVMRAAYVCFGLAALCGIPLILRGGWPLLAIGVASILCSYIYTGGPYPLAYNGLGELFVMIFFGFVAVAGTYYVQALTVDRAAIIAGYIAGSLATVLLVINNLRDVESDRASNKKTMAVRLGEDFARSEVASFASPPFTAQIFIRDFRTRSWLLLPRVSAFLALALIRRVKTSHGDRKSTRL